MNKHAYAIAAVLASGLSGTAQAALFNDSTGFGPVVEDFETFDGLVTPSPLKCVAARVKEAPPSEETATATE